MNSQAARQQTDGVKDRYLEYLARSRSGEALTHIEQICNHKDGKDRRLGNDETGHCDLAAIGKVPGCRRLWERICQCAHCFLPLFTAAVFICPAIHIGYLDLRDASGPTTAAGSQPLGWRQSYMQAEVSWWTIQVS